MIAQPITQAVGSTGTVRVAGLHAGALTAWRLVLSPTATQKGPDGEPLRAEDGSLIPAYTLFGEGTLLRYFCGATGAAVTADLVPVAPARIGRPRPRPVRPFRLAGVVVELTARRIVIASGEIV